MCDDAEECWDIPETVPEMPPAAPATDGSNELLEEEKAWVAALEAASAQAGIMAPNRFMLASWAIQAKGDVKKALTRMENYKKCEAKYRLSEITNEEATAWAKQTFPTLYYAAGENKDGLFVYGARGTERDPAKLKTEEDWRMLMKNMHMNLQTACPTLSHVRKGVGIIINLKGISLLSYNRDVEKKTAELTTNAFPSKVKDIYIVNPPSFLSVLFGIAKLIYSSKAMSRVKTLPVEQLGQHLQQSNLPSDLGGSSDIDWFAQRDLRMKVYESSVQQVAADQRACAQG